MYISNSVNVCWMNYLQIVHLLDLLLYFVLAFFQVRIINILKFLFCPVQKPTEEWLLQILPIVANQQSNVHLST